MSRQYLVADLVGVAVGETPGAAMQIDQRRERPLAAWLVNLREQRLVAVAKIFDVLHVEFVGPGLNGFCVHDRHSLNLRWVCPIVAQMANRDNPCGSIRPHAEALCLRGRMLSVPADRSKP